MEKRLKFCIIINVHASGGRKLKLVNKVIYLLKIDHDVELFKTISEENAKEIFKNLSVKNFDRIVLAGGDGSVCFGINQIFKYPSLADKKIGYIPTGTANILQIETKVSKNAEFIAKILIDDKKHEADWILSMNSKYYAGPYEVTKTTDIFQNGLVTYIFKDLTRVKLLYYLFLILFYGDLSRAKSIITTHAKNIKINKLNSNLVIQTDGEIFDSKERIEIQQTNKFIKLLTV